MDQNPLCVRDRVIASTDQQTGRVTANTAGSGAQRASNSWPPPRRDEIDARPIPRGLPPLSLAARAKVRWAGAFRATWPGRPARRPCDGLPRHTASERRPSVWYALTDWGTNGPEVVGGRPGVPRRDTQLSRRKADTGVTTGRSSDDKRLLPPRGRHAKAARTARTPLGGARLPGRVRRLRLEPCPALHLQPESTLAGAPALSPLGIRMVAHAIIAFGTPAQQDYYLPRILTGDVFFCQGYSEPEAGSDLASLSMSAVDGDDLVCTGSKIWTIHAAAATWMFPPAHEAVAAGSPDLHRHTGRHGQRPHHTPTGRPRRPRSWRPRRGS
ncbi:MAG: acyl-CoA dehydrogenase domain protein [Mycobacterium sp.]|nr:acyl-CoA dehydrogenase domain protein [Mycobacterium sp.]